MQFHRGHGQQLSNPAYLWALLGAAACASVAPLEPNLLEEGFVVEIAQRLARGDHLYRDAVAFTGPLPYELLGSLFRIFGESLVWGRLSIALLHGLATASVFSIARSGAARERAHIAAAIAAASPILLFPLLCLYFYTTLAFSLAMIAAWASLRGVESFRWAAAGGALVAGVALCKQTVGALLAIFLLLSLVGCSPPHVRRRVLLAFSAGGGAVAALTLAYYGALGDLEALFRSLVTLPLDFQSSFDAPYMNFWPPGVFSPAVNGSRLFYVPYFFVLQHGIWEVPGPVIILGTQVLYALPLIAILATLARRISGPLATGTWFHFGVLLALMANLFPRADWGHLVFVLPSACIQLLLLVAPARGERCAGRPRAAALACSVIALLSLVTLAVLYGHSVPPNLGPRIPFRSLSEATKGAALPHAIEYLRDHVSPEEEIFVARSEPLLYFATGTRNATPYGGVIPGMRAEQQSVIVEALGRIRYVVMNEIDNPVFTYYSEELPAVQDYLERHYEIARDYITGPNPPRLMILERGRDRGATAFDLIGMRESAKAWTRSQDDRITRAPVPSARFAARLNRRIMAHSIEPRGGGIDFDLEIPEEAVFQADVGFPYAFGAAQRFELPRLHMVSFRVSVARTGSGHFVEVGTTPAQPFVKYPLRRWIPMEIDLAEYAGENVTLRLELVAIRRIPREQSLAWWGSPRIAVRPAK